MAHWYQHDWNICQWNFQIYCKHVSFWYNWFTAFKHPDLSEPRERIACSAFIDDGHLRELFSSSRGNTGCHYGSSTWNGSRLEQRICVLNAAYWHPWSEIKSELCLYVLIECWHGILYYRHRITKIDQSFVLWVQWLLSTETALKWIFSIVQQLAISS